MGGRTPKTCWAVNKCQDKLKNCCIWLLIYLNCGISSFCKFLNRSDCQPGFSNCRCDAVIIFKVKCIFPVPFSLTFSYERRTSESELQTVTWEALMWHNSFRRSFQHCRTVSVGYQWSMMWNTCVYFMYLFSLGICFMLSRVVWFLVKDMAT
jgi:hypothetical protein